MYILVWLCSLFVVYKMNPPHRDVSVLLSVLLVLGALTAIIVGFIMRKKFFKLSTETLARDPRKARRHWRAANGIGFSCAMSVSVYGAALRLLGSDWLVAGILYGVSLGFLLLWRPRQLQPSGAQPA
jgi:hypothetical protein